GTESCCRGSLRRRRPRGRPCLRRGAPRLGKWRNTMRKLLLAGIAATTVATAAFAVPTQNLNLRQAADELGAAQLQDVQYRFGGHRHCWYARGWNGPGWYWCGYGRRHGRGWGGGEGWNDWRHR